MCGHPLNASISKIQGLLNVTDSVRILFTEAKHQLQYSIIAVEQLLSNAIRYNDKPKAIIQIRFEENEAFYLLEVENTGGAFRKNIWRRSSAIISL
jgi:light-regulated signal transduction histidine kinase (bacteriophytochrome)